MEVAPRTRILGAVPNVPDTFWTETPDARPSSARLISGTPSNLAFSASTFAVEPVKSRLSIFCIPVTTTPSRYVASSCITIWIGSGDTFAEAVLIPRNVTMISLASAGTALIPNLPSASVIVPIVVPLTRT